VGTASALFSAYCVCSVVHIVVASFLLLFLDMCGDRFALCVVQSVLAIKFDYRRYVIPNWSIAKYFFL
jgi:hypothetical protein